ncbi:hypothetical protein GCM10011391_12640 [Pullulanibacillus camelliae]|uniref:DUF4260 family protein n=1 Tax=Pullulanibacillus camelliae TaxID=1707096 RepID=A0A8J2VNN6_9BACL|nr:DUF4260 domain-containing protein [Pullulanibacillus camelliae]GGE35388.1 hypothetical protein GCM10011391_12640 [Pullulanibacillus camelliae]
MKNAIVLRIEGLVVLALCVYFYFFNLQFNWLVFVILLLAPDVSQLGYLQNARAGAVWYNLFHTYSIPMAILACSVLAHNHILLVISLIWVAHIGMDRMLGYGLKYPTKFQDTHLNRV